MAASYTWANLLSSNLVSFTIDRMDKSGRIQLTCTVRPYTLTTSLVGIAGTTTNVLRTKVERDVYLVGVTLGMNEKGTASSTTVTVNDDGTPISTGASISGAVGGGVADTSTDESTAIGAGSIVSSDLVVAVGASVASIGLILMPGQVLLRIAPPQAVRVESYRFYGDANTSTGSTTVSVRKNGTTLTGGSASATPSSTVIDSSSNSITAGNGDYAIGDELSLQLDAVSSGLKYVTIILQMRAAIF